MEVLVRRRDDAAPAARRAIDLLDADLRRFRRLVEDLLEISKIDQGAFRLSAEPFDLAELAEKVVGRVQPELTVDQAGDCCVVADRRRLEQVVANLVDNAEQHGRHRGRRLGHPNRGVSPGSTAPDATGREVRMAAGRLHWTERGITTAFRRRHLELT